MFDRTKLQEFPTCPGVYLMKDKEGVVLYVGKAVNVKARVKQYFLSSHDDRPQIPYLVEQIETIETIIVSSEKEALLLENTLIKRYKPKYNVLLKDDKSHLCLKLSKHAYPMLSLYRYKGKKPTDGEYFGPYPNAEKARHMFDLVVKLFQLRQCSDEEFKRRTRPCLMYDMKRCSAPCVNFCTHDEYSKQIRQAKRFLTGHDNDIIKELKEEMQAAADALEFEKAGTLYTRINLLEKIYEKQAVEAISTPSLDVIGMWREGEDVVIAKLLYRDNKLIGSSHFEFEHIVSDDSELLESFLMQHYLQKVEGDELPKEIIVACDLPNPHVLAEVISIPVYVPKKGDKKRIAELAIMNAKAGFAMRKDSKELLEKQLIDLQERLHLSRFPHRIECFDNSHLSGSDCVSSMVVFIDGKKSKGNYRKFHVKEAKSSDDYGALSEVLHRRYSKAAKDDLPDLIMIDGGKGHYSTACKVLAKLNITSCDIIAIAKEEGRHDKGLTQEAIFFKDTSKPIVLDRHSPMLLLLQKIRDEAHRFAITFQKVTRKKSLIKSELDQVAGIGPVKKKKLLQAFGSVKAIREASVEALCKVQGITQKDAETILNALSRDT
jgi:excinuclease ABC subunit C